jgi:hypothetical protein
VTGDLGTILGTIKVSQVIDANKASNSQARDDGAAPSASGAATTRISALEFSTD